MTSFDPSRDCAGHYVLFKEVVDPQFGWNYRGWQFCWGCYSLLIYAFPPSALALGAEMNCRLARLRAQLSGWYTTGVGADFIR